MIQVGRFEKLFGENIGYIPDLIAEKSEIVDYPEIWTPYSIRRTARSIYCRDRNAFSDSLLLDQSPLNSGTRRNGEEGRCVDLNGTNQAVRVTDNTALDITDNLTVCVWAKNDNALLSATNAVFSKYDFANNKREWSLQLNLNEELDLAFGDPNDGTLESISTVASGFGIDSWRHYAFTFEAGTVKIYIDGVSKSFTNSAAPPLSLYSNNSDLIIGGANNNGASTSFFDGQIFDARIYAGDSTVLTAEQIAAIYADGPNNIQFTGQTLRAHYKLDEQSGTTCYDSSGNGNHGTIENAVSNWGVTQDIWSFQNQVGYNTSGAVYIPRDESDPTNDVLGNPLTNTGRRPNDAALHSSNCVTFDGADDYVDVSDLRDTLLDSSFSVSTWFNKTDATSDNDRFFDYSIDANNTLQITTDQTSQKYAVKMVVGGVTKVDAFYDALDFGAWHHLTCTWDGSSNFKAYLDGVEMTAGSTTPIGYGAAGKSIGRRNDGSSTTFFEGSLVDFRIYDDELTAAEALYLYDNSRGTDPTVTDIYAHYPLSEGAGIRAHDVSGNGNHGTLNNFTLSNAWGVTQDIYHKNLSDGFVYAYQPAKQVFTGAQAANITGISFKFRSTDTNLLIFNDGYILPYLFIAQAGSSLTELGATAGPFIISVDGSSEWGTTRGQLHSVVCDGNVHNISISPLNFNLNSEWITNGVYVNSYTGLEWDSTTYLWDLQATDSNGDPIYPADPDVRLPAVTSSVGPYSIPLTDLPSNSYRNRAETLIDLDPDSTPEMGATQLGITVPVSHAFGDAFAASDQIFSRQSTLTEDRFVVMPEAQTGSALATIQKYTQP